MATQLASTLTLSPRMLIVAAVVAVVAVLVLTRPEGADVAQARKETAAAIARADGVLAENRMLKSRADSALSEAARQEKLSVAASADLANAKRTLFKAALAAPDTCAPVVLAAQVALADADKLVESRTRELSAALAADAVDRKRADDAEASLIDLKRPAATLVAATNQGLLARLKRLRPQLSAGVLGGVDIQGKPNAVVGVGITVHF